MVAVVTGGSRGIGKGIAEALLEISFTVIVTARNKGVEIEELEKVYNDKILFVPCDISKEEDRKNLSMLCGYEVVGMAYPGGGKNCDERVANVVHNRTGVQYARTNRSVYCYDLPKNLYFIEGVSYIDERLDSVIDEFLALETDKPQLLYIWGHSYEMDFEYITWEKFEALCKKLSGRADIFYGTNKEVLLEK